MVLSAYDGANATVNVIIASPQDDDAILVAGAFTSAGDVPCVGVCQWNQGEEEWSALGSGLNGVVGAMDVAGVSCQRAIRGNTDTLFRRTLNTYLQQALSSSMALQLPWLDMTLNLLNGHCLATLHLCLVQPQQSVLTIETKAVSMLQDRPSTARLRTLSDGMESAGPTSARVLWDLAARFLSSPSSLCQITAIQTM